MLFPQKSGRISNMVLTSGESAPRVMTPARLSSTKTAPWRLHFSRQFNGNNLFEMNFSQIYLDILPKMPIFAK